MEDQQLKDLITHVFLPRRIEIVEKDAEIPHINFIELFIKSLRVLSKNFLKPFHFSKTPSLFMRNIFPAKNIERCFSKEEITYLLSTSTKLLFITKPKDKDYQITLYPSPFSTEDKVFDNHCCQLPEVSYLIETSRSRIVLSNNCVHYNALHLMMHSHKQ